jgi:hypothetical protein
MRFAAIALGLCLAVSAFAADVTGKWTATLKTPDGQDMQQVIDLKQDGNKLSGTIETPMGQMPISEGKVDGDAISFTIEMNDMKIVHQGTVSGDEMKLKIQFGDQTFEMTAKRSKS